MLIDAPDLPASPHRPAPAFLNTILPLSSMSWRRRWPTIRDAAKSATRSAEQERSDMTARLFAVGATP
jgi:hypothetical protein